MENLIDFVITSLIVGGCLIVVGIVSTFAGSLIESGDTLKMFAGFSIFCILLGFVLTALTKP
jgi:hypothetical protein